MRNNAGVDVLAEILALDVDVYPLIAIQKAAYEFSARCNIRIETPDEAHATVTFESSTLRREDLQYLSQLFANRLLHLGLQQRINEETRPIREALTKAALYEALKPRKS